MANRNRTEVAAAIEALAAVVDLEDLKEAVNDFFAQSCVFRKDVSTSDTASGTKTLNFTDIDYIAITQSASTTYTLSGVQQGEVKYLKISKTAGHLIAFTGATDTGPGQAFTNQLTVILYRITNKDGSNIMIEPISQFYESTDWQTPSYNANFSAGTNAFEYRIYQNKLEFRGDITTTLAASNSSPFTLPAAYRPANDATTHMETMGASVNPIGVEVRADGTIRAYTWLQSSDNRFNTTIILD